MPERHDEGRPNASCPATESGQEEERLPLDARLLSEAIIEFNISRRSVGLYPPGHAVITGAIERSFGLLERLFELRSSISLGVARDGLVIDDRILDRRNPVYVECALGFHERGIAAITFSAGLAREELVALHELLTERDGPAGAALAQRARDAGISHIGLIPIDFSSFRFVENAVKRELTKDGIWEDYVHGLLSGRLSPANEGNVLHGVAPERLAEILNEAAGETAAAESYDHVITSYIRRKGEARLSAESLEKLATLIDNLGPAIKGQFLSRTFQAVPAETADVERVLREMTREGFERLVTAFAEHGSAVPETLKNLIDKLSATSSRAGYTFDMKYARSAVVHDIELDEDVLKLFDDDHFTSYVSEDYQQDLTRMLEAEPLSAAPGTLAELVREAEGASVDRVASEVMLEVIQADVMSREEYLNIIGRLAELSAAFLDTGRFEEALNVYNTLRGQAFTGRFIHEAQSTITYFFHAEAFLERFVQAVRLWGRNNRDGVMRFCKSLRARVTGPLLDALAEEQSAGMRRFMLSVLTELSDEVLPEAVKRLKDPRWFVVRNMLYLIRHSDDAANAGHVRPFVKSPHAPVAAEALRALLNFRTTDAVPHLKTALRSDDGEVRAQAAALAGAHRLRETVPLLMETVRRRDALGTTCAAKIPAVRALGEIGDARALEALYAVLRSRSLLFRSGLEELKLEICKSLRRYPRDAVRPLLEQGLASTSPEIRAACEQLAKEFGESTRD